MNKFLNNLSRIEFVVTSACTGRCKHYSQGDHITIENIDKNFAIDAVKRIAKEYNIGSVMTFGGEPLLCRDTVCEIHKAAKEITIPHRQLITNGYFSKDSDEIKDVAKKLIDCGVNDILISVDAFHQEAIPIDVVKTFAIYIKEYSINTDAKVRIQPAWLVSSTDDNRYNIITRNLLDEFKNLGFDENQGNIVFPSGNALKYFSEYFEQNEIVKNPYEEDPEDIKAICFSANGDILGGNIYKESIINILNRYKP